MLLFQVVVLLSNSSKQAIDASLRAKDYSTSRSCSTTDNAGVTVVVIQVVSAVPIPPLLLVVLLVQV